MPLVGAQRTQDLANSRTLANLGIAAVWPGATWPTVGYAHADVAVEAVAAGTLELQESEDGLAWTTTLTLAVRALTVALTTVYRLPLTQLYWRALYTQGAGAGNVGITSRLDPRPLSWGRRADVPNTRALANLGIAGVWTGGAQPRAEFARVDLIIEAVQAGSLALQESQDGITWTTTETWAVPVGTPAGTAFPFQLSQAYWRAVYTQGGVAGNFSLACTLDPRPVDHEVPFVQSFMALVNGANYAPLPLGARRVMVQTKAAALPYGAPLFWYATDATGLLGGPAQPQHGSIYGANVVSALPRVLDDGVTPPTQLLLYMTSPPCPAWCDWYP